MFFIRFGHKITKKCIKKSNKNGKNNRELHDK